MAPKDSKYCTQPFLDLLGGSPACAPWPPPGGSEPGLAPRLTSPCWEGGLGLSVWVPSPPHPHGLVWLSAGSGWGQLPPQVGSVPRSPGCPGESCSGLGSRAGSLGWVWLPEAPHAGQDGGTEAAWMRGACWDGGVKPLPDSRRHSSEGPTSRPGRQVRQLRGAAGLGRLQLERPAVQNPKPLHLPVW